MSTFQYYWWCDIYCLQSALNCLNIADIFINCKKYIGKIYISDFAFLTCFPSIEQFSWIKKFADSLMALSLFNKKIRGILCIVGQTYLEVECHRCPLKFYTIQVLTSRLCPCHRSFDVHIIPICLSYFLEFWVFHTCPKNRLVIKCFYLRLICFTVCYNMWHREKIT